jgi:hypothetical protein
MIWLALRRRAASVGRKSAAPSAAPQSRAYSHRAGLSSQSGFGLDILLHCEPARPPVGFAGDSNRRVAGCGSAGPRPRAVPHRRLGRASRPHALPMDRGLRRGRLLPEGDADFPGRWRAIKKGFSKSVRIGERRSPVMIHRGERGIWQRRYWEHTIRDDRDLAAHLDYSFQSGEPRFGQASGGVAAFLLLSLCCRRAGPGGVAAQRRRAAGDG